MDGMEIMGRLSVHKIQCGAVLALVKESARCVCPSCGFSVTVDDLAPLLRVCSKKDGHAQEGGPASSLQARSQGGERE